MAEPLYALRDLTLSLPDLTRKPLLGAAPRIDILKGITLDIARGEVIGIIGGSGSGNPRWGARWSACWSQPGVG